MAALLLAVAVSSICVAYLRTASTAINAAVLPLVIGGSLYLIAEKESSHA